MVEVEIIEDEPKTKTGAEAAIPLSQERQLDADEIESLCQKYATRPSVKAHLKSLVQKIRRDSQAMKRMEDSRARKEKEEEEEVAADVEEEKVKVEEVKKVEPEEPAGTNTSATASTDVTTPAAAAKAASSSTSATTATPPMPSSSAKYKPIDKFAFDAGGYNSPSVTIYITSLPEIGSIIPRENITCDFTKTSFDLKIHDYKGADYRLLKDNLDKDINPEKSKIIVKSSKIVIKLGKVKGEYGSFESWTDLTSKKTKESKMKSSKKDPSASIMEMMKEMYDSGDDNMKKVIGEAMLKQREGKMNNGPGGMGGMDEMGGLGDM